MRFFLLALLGGLLAGPALADAPCRIAFDMGSSGIRAGTSTSSKTVHSDADYLKLLQSDGGLRRVSETAQAALRTLMEDGRFETGCQKVGGGFSVWRMALQQDREGLVAELQVLHARSGVSVLVVPQMQEGAYGYHGSRRLLGDRLTTSHVLDIGGGSLQIAGERSGYGDALGQKLWHRQLCARLRPGQDLPCTLQPMSEEELAASRQWLAERLKPMATGLPAKLTLTAVSRPVSRGVLPALAESDKAGVDAEGFSLAALDRAIGRLAATAPSQSAATSGRKTSHAAYLLSDMLLVEGILKTTGTPYLHVAEVDLTNIPGLLADDRAFDWGARYACYLQRLQAHGADAYATDPASCGKQEIRQ